MLDTKLNLISFRNAIFNNDEKERDLSVHMRLQTISPAVLVDEAWSVLSASNSVADKLKDSAVLSSLLHMIMVKVL